MIISKGYIGRDICNILRCYYIMIETTNHTYLFTYLLLFIDII